MSKLKLDLSLFQQFEKPLTMSRGRNISIEEHTDGLVPFIQSYGTDGQQMMNNLKCNYSTITSMEEGNLPSNYSTVSSCSFYPRDTAVLLHNEHKKFEENRQKEMRERSLKATLCFVFTILILLALVGVAIASIRYKLMIQDFENQQNFTTLSDMEEPDLRLNGTDLNFNGTDLSLIRSTALLYIENGN